MLWMFVFINVLYVEDWNKKVCLPIYLRISVENNNVEEKYKITFRLAIFWTLKFFWTSWIERSRWVLISLHKRKKGRHAKRNNSQLSYMRWKAIASPSLEYVFSCIFLCGESLKIKKKRNTKRAGDTKLLEASGKKDVVKMEREVQSENSLHTIAIILLCCGAVKMLHLLGVITVEGESVLQLLSG